jgi:hypothetical protein
MNGRDDLPAAQTMNSGDFNDNSANFDLPGLGSIPFVFDNTEQPPAQMPGELQSELPRLDSPSGQNMTQSGLLDWDSNYLPPLPSNLSPNSLWHDYQQMPQLDAPQIPQHSDTPSASSIISVSQQALAFGEAEEPPIEIKEEPQPPIQPQPAMPSQKPAARRGARKRQQTVHQDHEEKERDNNSPDDSYRASSHSHSRKKTKNESAPDTQLGALKEEPHSKAFRNKVSARDYRNRKKQFIQQLEDQLSQAQTLNGSQAEEIERLQSENAELRARLTRFEEQQRAQIPRGPQGLLSQTEGYLDYSSIPLPSSQSGLFFRGNGYEQSNGHAPSHDSVHSNGYRRG